MRVNHEIRARELRVISATGEQLGVMPFSQAMDMAKQQGLDLVEIVATSTPPVAKIVDHGKLRYEQAKREKENKKAQQHVKVKEIKLNLNIGEHDLQVKMAHAKEFLEDGDKVKVAIMFRGREMAHPELGVKLSQKFIDGLEEVSMIEVPPKQLGRFINFVLAPGSKSGSKQGAKKQKE